MNVWLIVMAACVGQVSTTHVQRGRPPLGALGTEPVADKSPTSWSCNLETLSSGRECVFESEVQPSSDIPAQRAQNIKFARELAPNLCSKVSRASNGDPDPRLAQMCERHFTAAAEHCGLEGQVPLVDPQGRFAPGSRGCYRVLSEVLQRMTVMGLLSSRCCQCMSKNHCAGSSDRCYQDLSRGNGASLDSTCAANSCADECQEAPMAKPEAEELQSTQLPSIPANKRPVAHEL